MDTQNPTDNLPVDRENRGEEVPSELEQVLEDEYRDYIDTLHGICAGAVQ